MAEVVFSPESKSNRVKVVSGAKALDASNPTAVSVAGKMRSVVSVQLTLLDATAPGVGTSVLTYSVSGTAVSVYAWKPTSSSNPTLIASTGTETFSYTVIGY